MPVFDPLVFDTIFDTFDPIPTLLKVAVEPEHKKVTFGQGVNITIHIVNLTTTPGRRFLFNPSSRPEITIYDGSGEPVVTSQAMTNFATGIYTYNYIVHEDVIQVFDGITFDTIFDTTIRPAPVNGVYTGSFFCRNGSYTMQTALHELFTVL